ncbi:MAG: Hsp33 family molecular chaperone HslO [Culicoidibacterales bacterium]
MNDYIIKALAFNNEARVYIAQTTQTVSEIVRRHEALPAAAAALGRSATAGAIMGAMLKGNQRLTLRIEGNGPIGKIIIDANAEGQVGGYCDNPSVHFHNTQTGKVDVKAVVGTQGSVRVVKDIGVRELFTSESALVSGEIGEDIAYYFTVSEQVPSAVAVGVYINPENEIESAGGFIIQLLPNASEATIQAIEAALANIPSTVQLLHDGETPETILTLLAGTDAHILEKLPVQFNCQCSYERFARGIVTLGQDEIRNMIADGGAQTTCHFCNEVYDFDVPQLEILLADAKRNK